MSKPYRIILDIDDVLNNLTLHIMRHFGCDIGEFEYSAFPLPGTYDVSAAVEAMGQPIPQMQNPDFDTVYAPSTAEFIRDIPEFWESVTKADLWRTCPKSPQCVFIVETAAMLVGREQVYLATTPTKCPVSHAHKLEWIWENLPEWIHRQYFLTPRKWCLGKPGVVLIDDNTDNCRLFEEEGGHAILLPRPWNARHDLNTDEVLVSELNSLFGETTHA